jgi:hypothetical protein
MSDQLEQKLEQPADGPESREDELTRRVTRWVEGPLVTVCALILVYYGGNAYGNSQYISHPLWQGILLWPIVAVSFVLLIIDRAGHKRPPRAERQAMPAMPKNERRAARIARAQPMRRVSRAIARRIIARQERKGIQT